LPSSYHDVRADGNGLIGTVTGMGTAKAATSIMALGRLSFRERLVSSGGG
jgi:purine nucleoside permease